MHAGLERARQWLLGAWRRGGSLGQLGLRPVPMAGCRVDFGHGPACAGSRGLDREGSAVMPERRAIAAARLRRVSLEQETECRLQCSACESLSRAPREIGVGQAETQPGFRIPRVALGQGPESRRGAVRLSASKLRRRASASSSSAVRFAGSSSRALRSGLIASSGRFSLWCDSPSSNQAGKLGLGSARARGSVRTARQRLRTFPTKTERARDSEPFPARPGRAAPVPCRAALHGRSLGPSSLGRPAWPATVGRPAGRSRGWRRRSRRPPAPWSGELPSLLIIGTGRNAGQSENCLHVRG